MLSELKIALRRLVTSPSLTLPAIATLTIGMAGTIGIFGTMNATVLGALLMKVFAVVSLALAAVGIYGIVGHSLFLRSKEFAVRMALGENSPRLALSVLRQGGTVWIAGLLAGIVAVYVAGQ